MHMTIVTYGTIPVLLYMPWSFFFETKMKYLTAIPSGENTGAPLFGPCYKIGPFLGVASSSVPFFTQSLVCLDSAIRKLRKMLSSVDCMLVAHFFSENKKLYIKNLNKLCFDLITSAIPQHFATHFFYVAFRITTYLDSYCTIQTNTKGSHLL
jgi:hypothetical protein